MTPFNLRFKRPLLFKEGLIFLTVFSSVCIAFYLLSYAPAMREITVLKGEIERFSREIANHQASVAASENEAKKTLEVIKTYDEIKDKGIFLSEQIPPAKEVSNIIREISSLRAGITLLSLHASHLEDKGNYLRLPLSVQIRSDFPSLGAYLEKIENSGRLISVENLSIAKNGQEKPLVKMELAAYLMKEGGI